MHREQLQRERGLCSMPRCDEPIAGWCATCDKLGPFKAPKLCTEHLTAHTHRFRSPYKHFGHQSYLLYEQSVEGIGHE